MRSKGEGPSVTEVLSLVQDYSNIPPHILEAARIRGTETHHAVELINENKFDQDFFSDSVMPYIRAYQMFLATQQPLIINQEVTVQVSVPLAYHGRYDVLAMIDDERWLLDVKTTSAAYKKPWAMQCAAYAAGVAVDGKAVDKIGVIHLLKSGEFNLIDLSPMRERAIKLFYGLLSAWYTIQEINNTKPREW